MTLRILNLIVIGMLVLAAAHVYRIKFDSTVQAERLAKLRGEVRHERDAIAALRAEWGQLDAPARIEVLAKRHLQLQPVAPTQFDTLAHLPERPMASPASGPNPGATQPDRAEDVTSTTGSITPAVTPHAAAPAAAGPLINGSTGR